jgi:lipid-binding SYLF domain-containing protein
MKNGLLISAAMAIFALSSANAWDPGKIDERKAESQVVTDRLLEADSGMQRFFDAAAGYVVLPNVGKGGIGIGGARGKGLLFVDGEAIAEVTMTQLSIGFQWGGQAYSEFIFFEDEKILNEFKEGNFEFGAQASAVAITAGISTDAAFERGMAVFTQVKGGLMYEASIGGQKFKVEILE